MRKVTRYTYDDNGADYISVSLYKTTPATGGETWLAYVESTGSSSGIREFSDTTIEIEPR